MKIPYVMKKCNKCGRWLVASKVNFHRGKSYKHGLTAQCKECRSKKNKQWRENNREKVLERQKQYREDNKDKISEHRKQYYKANKDKVLEQHKQYREANKEKVAEHHKQYYEANKERIAVQHKQYCEDNKEKVAERHKQWYKANKDKVLEQHKQYSQTPQGQVVAFNSAQRRRAKQQQQGTGITKDQWLEMMSFFDFRCAYSGEYIGGDSFNRTIDHIIPVSKNGPNMIWNCVPMLRSLNSSKHNKDMLTWYKTQECFNRERLDKIYQWQEYAFNKWYKEEE